MRNFLVVLAVAGCLAIGVGILYSMTWPALLGAAAVIVAVVMAALAAPGTRGER